MTTPYVELAGSPRAMGNQHGEQFADPIAAFAASRLETCAEYVHERGGRITAEQILDLCQAMIEPHRRYAPAVYEEFAGIAEAANISLPSLMMCNGLTDIRGAALNLATGNRTPAKPDTGGCTSWMVAPDATAAGHVLVGQTWDMSAHAMPYVTVFRRMPVTGPATLGLSTIGCLCLTGINEAGLAIGNNNLEPSDAKPGVMYLAMITHALAQSSLAQAANAITTADRCSGHNYYLTDADGTLVNIETTANAFDVTDPTGGFYVHTNHYLNPSLAPLQREDPTESTLYRLDRMGRLLHDVVGDITPETMMHLMADRAGTGDCNICRTDPADDAPTCGAIVMSPATGEIWATRGAPADNPLCRFTFGP